MKLYMRHGLLFKELRQNGVGYRFAYRLQDFVAARKSGLDRESAQRAALKSTQVVVPCKELDNDMGR